VNKLGLVETMMSLEKFDEKKMKTTGNSFIKKLLLSVCDDSTHSIHYLEMLKSSKAHINA
jgi:hypothetical protein